MKKYKKVVYFFCEKPVNNILLSGGDGEGVTPVPIPNTEVKSFSADGTWVATPWESRTSPGRNELIFFACCFACKKIKLYSFVKLHSVDLFFWLIYPATEWLEVFGKMRSTVSLFERPRCFERADKPTSTGFACFNATDNRDRINTDNLLLHFENWIQKNNAQLGRSNWLIGDNPLMVKLQRAHGGCLGARSRRRT